MADPMSRPTFEQLRILAALILIVLAAVVFLPRLGDAAESATATPGATIVAGQPGGEITSTTSAAAVASPSPVATPPATPEATPQPTPQPVEPDRFTAEVLACRSISGSECRGELGRMRGNARSVTALVLFTDAKAGDAISVTLDGPSGAIAGGPYTLQGGGDGYYYSVFNIGGLPRGDYTLTATRNGSDVATTSFRRGR